MGRSNYRIAGRYFNNNPRPAGFSDDRPHISRTDVPTLGGNVSLTWGKIYQDIFFTLEWDLMEFEEVEYMQALYEALGGGTTYRFDKYAYLELYPPSLTQLTYLVEIVSIEAIPFNDKYRDVRITFKRMNESLGYGKAPYGQWHYGSPSVSAGYGKQRYGIFAYGDPST